MKTKQEAILDYMQRHGKDGITQKQAYLLFDTTRLAVHIDKLRRKGYKIETIVEHGRDTFGPNQYGRYVLMGGNDD